MGREGALRTVQQRPVRPRYKQPKKGQQKLNYQARGQVFKEQSRSSIRHGPLSVGKDVPTGCVEEQKGERTRSGEACLG